MYQCSSYPDPFLHSLFSAFPYLQPQPPSPPPPHHRDHHHHHHTFGYHLYPPSSPPSAGGGFLTPAPPSSPPLPSTYLQGSGGGGSSSSCALSIHNHLLDRNHHCSGCDGGSVSSPHFYDQPDFFDFPSAVQGTNGTLLPPPGAESCTQEVGGAGGGAAAAMAGGRVGRYTAEERKERIERYRSKRNHRNFQKKITYACRKTLADSRPRVRGRFARNGDAEAEAEVGEVSSCNNSSSHSGAECFGWRPAVDEEDEYGTCDPNFWANFLDTLSMNNPMPIS